MRWFRVNLRFRGAFTLIEMLVVMAIIGILAALTLMAGSAVMQKASRSRASSEIQAMSTALEGYKTDNGIYAASDGVLTTNSPYSAYDGTTANYQTNSTLLYIALSGQTNFVNPPAAGTKTYMQFKANQVGKPTSAYSYINDPWGYSYGYSTGTNSALAPAYPYNGSGFFDLWSTGGLLVAKVNTNAWISNWQ